MDDSDDDSNIEKNTVENDANSTEVQQHNNYYESDENTNLEGPHDNDDATENASEKFSNNQPETGATQHTHTYGTRSRGVRFAPDATMVENPTVAREFNRLGISTDDTENQTGREEHASAAVFGLFDEFVFLSTETVDLIEPRNFREAWNHPDPMQREKWRGAIQKEFKDMMEREIGRAHV